MRSRTRLELIAAALMMVLIGWLCVTHTSAMPQDDPLDEYVVSETEDLDADAVADTVVAEPLGPSITPGPGRVSVYAGDNGSLIARIYGVQVEDRFGYVTRTDTDLDGDLAHDLIISAPLEDAGRVHVFYGPFNSVGTIQITSAESDYTFASPDWDTYEFGDAVATTPDLDGDWLPDLRIRAWTMTTEGEVMRTYIVSGATGESLYTIYGTEPFDPWADLAGDVNGDGQVDQLDIDAATAELGLTLQDRDVLRADFDGDGIVTGLDLASVQGGFGANIYAPLIGLTDGYGMAGYWTTSADGGTEIFLPENAVIETRGLGGIGGGGSGGCGYVIVPELDIEDPCVDDVITLTVNPLTPATWSIPEGSNLIQPLTLMMPSTIFQFRALGDPGHVRIRATMNVDPTCPQNYDDMEFDYDDSDLDCDGMPNDWENQYGLDPYDPSDANEDPDGDGLTNLGEFQSGSYPNSPDSDGDGTPDGGEVLGGSDPNDPSDGGVGPETDDVLYVRLKFGDPGHGPSGETDVWAMKFGDIEYVHPANLPNIWYTPALAVKRGESYPIEMIWKSTSFQNPFDPDYDYHAWVYVVDKNNGNPRELIELDDHGNPGAWWDYTYDSAEPVEGVYVYDPLELMGEHHDSSGCSTPSCNPANGKTAHLVFFDLDVDTHVRTHQDNYLTEAEEDTPGAFLPVNNDDDDYNHQEDGVQAMDPVELETDLLPIRLLGVPAFVGGVYELSIPSNLSVYENPDRTSVVFSFSTFDATVDTVLYVEGDSTGTGSLSVHWTDGSDSYQDIDAVKLSVFEWDGTYNVPGYTIYGYSVTGGPAGGHWLDPYGGTVHSGGGTNDIEVLWGEGPEVGRVIYYANDNYVWDLEVNVVKVHVLATGASNQATYLGPPVQVNVVYLQGDAAPNPPHAMSGSIGVYTIAGPVVDGTPRGQRYIEVGLCHQGRLDLWEGLYNDSVPPQRIRFSLQDGNVYWDSSTAQDVPWVFRNDDHYLAGQDGAHMGLHIFETFDTPRLPGTDPNRIVLAGDQVDEMNIIFTHWVYLGVRVTTDGPTVVHQRAMLEWVMNATGTVDTNMIWTQSASAGIGGYSSFVEVTDGSLVPQAGGNLNDVAGPAAVWIQETQ